MALRPERNRRAGVLGCEPWKMSEEEERPGGQGWLVGAALRGAGFLPGELGSRRNVVSLGLGFQPGCATC